MVHRARPSPPPPPSLRNLLIYHELAWQGSRQADVAAVYGLAQCRVSQIGRRVRAWVDRIVPPRECRGEPGRRLHLAILRERLRLHQAFDPVIAMFTSEEGQERYLRRYVAVVNGEPLPTIEITERHDFGLWNQAVDVLARLGELESVANLGPFGDLVGQVRQTIVHRWEKRQETPPPSESRSSKPYETASDAFGKTRRGVLPLTLLPVGKSSATGGAATSCDEGEAMKSLPESGPEKQLFGGR